jgi:hypothetical protein
LLGLAVLLLAGPTFAQTVTLQLLNEGPGNQIGGEYTYPYDFSVNGSTSNTPLLCDDYLRSISNGEIWTANVYSLTSPLTVFGQSSQIPGYTPAQVYEAAAIIYSEILNNTVPGANGNAGLASAYGNLAVWVMFDSGAQGNSGYDSTIITPIITNALNSTGLYGSSFYSQFSGAGCGFDQVPGWWFIFTVPGTGAGGSQLERQLRPSLRLDAGRKLQHIGPG